MKIFSLETKKYLVAWSMVLGFFVDVFVTVGFKYGNCVALVFGGRIQCSGWPIAIDKNSHDSYGRVLSGGILIPLFLDLLFWIVAVFIILFITRNFKKKQN